MNKTVLFVTHKPKQCGVYEFGRNVFNAISASKKYNFVNVERDSLDDLKIAIAIREHSGWNRHGWVAAMMTIN